MLQGKLRSQPAVIALGFCFCAISAPAGTARAQTRGGGFFADPVGGYAGLGTDEEEGGEDDAAEAESEQPQPAAPGPGIRYSGDLTEAELQRRWKEDLASLGSISVGFADRGRLINAVRMPEDDAWVCQRPQLAYGAQETVDALATAFRAVRKQFPDSAPARLSHIGLPDGGFLRPHRSHQSGRDADVGFFYRNDRLPVHGARRDRLMDPARNWALVRTLVTETDVQMILVDRSIQKVLRSYAVGAGEDRAWVDSLFAGPHSLIRHARHHQDHFHVRFYAPRSQELGRRIVPLLADRADQNIVLHRVRRGETLSVIARVTGSSVQTIRKANRLRTPLLRLGQQLRIPLRGPCTKCPLPPAVVVPPRRIPGGRAAAAVAAG